ncbi:MAG: class I SAM-dependent methyltransferase [Nannocystaceae bacterium]|nr:class I SAM-dependent methyltransferase [Nannocystaceae bacterium]
MMAKPDKNKSKSSKSNSKGKGRAKPKKKSIATRADKHKLYQAAVQSPEADVEFFSRVFKDLRGRAARSMREDFCGTGFLSCTWAASKKTRSAFGVDLDEPTLQWGREHNLAPLSEAAQARVQLANGNVLDGLGEPTDFTCALNFSYGVFKTREELRRYFEVARENLAPDGIFITELYGGFEAIVEVEEERDLDGFTYIWEQASYNPIDHHTLCHIHFEFPDGSKIRKAFTYDWRLWTVPELRELLIEAGFSDTKVYWERTDKDGDGTGDYVITEEEENQDSWLVYIVGVK